MASVTQKSGLFAKYGASLDQAVKAHGNDATDYGPQRLPPGITNGIAKLVVCKFDKVAAGKTNAGEYYFRAAGVVVEPYSVNVNGREEVVQGRQTSIMEMVCTTKNRDGKETTQEDHVASILNEMRKLADDAFTANKGGTDLEEMAAALQQHGPYFKFSTSPRMDQVTGKPSGEAWENWNGNKGLEDYSPPTPDAIQDDTVAPAPVNRVADQTQQQVASKPQANGKPPSKKPPVATASADDFKDAEEKEAGLSASLTLEQLVEIADKDGNPNQANAQLRLKELAAAEGWGEEQIDGASSWSEVAEMATPADAAPDQAVEHSVGQMWNWKVIVLDKATKKKTVAKVATQHEITAIDAEKQTVSLKSADNPKITFKGVPIAQLEAL